MFVGGTVVLAKRNRGGESTAWRQRRAAIWMTGIAMSAFVAVQAVENDVESTKAVIFAEPIVHAEPIVEVVVQATDKAEAKTRCQGADSLLALTEGEATTEADPNDAGAASEGHQSDTDVLVLQIEASHYRNLDQTSLVFRGDVVDLFTNNSDYQKDPVRLGWLRAPMTRDFESLRARIETYRSRILNEETPTEPVFSPHAPVLRIGAVEISSGHPCFDELERIFREVWDVEWSCVDCATYERKGDSIVRTRTRNGEKHQMEVPEHLLETLWECGPVWLDTSRLGCADPEFGTFEVDDDGSPASATEGNDADGS